MMSPSEAKTMSDFHYILGKSSFCLSLHLSRAVKPNFLPAPCQSSAACQISNDALEDHIAAFYFSETVLPPPPGGCKKKGDICGFASNKGS